MTVSLTVPSLSSAVSAMLPLYVLNSTRPTLTVSVSVWTVDDVSKFTFEYATGRTPKRLYPRPGDLSLLNSVTEMFFRMFFPLGPCPELACSCTSECDLTLV